MLSFETAALISGPEKCQQNAKINKLTKPFCMAVIMFFFFFVFKGIFETLIFIGLEPLLDLTYYTFKVFVYLFSIQYCDTTVLGYLYYMEMNVGTFSLFTEVVS